MSSGRLGPEDPKIGAQRPKKRPGGLQQRAENQPENSLSLSLSLSLSIYLYLYLSLPLSLSLYIYIYIYIYIYLAYILKK